MINRVTHLIPLLFLFSCFFDNKIEETEEVDKAVFIEGWKQKLKPLNETNPNLSYSMPDCYPRGNDSLICPETASIIDVENGVIHREGFNFWKSKGFVPGSMGHSTILTNNSGIFLTTSDHLKQDSKMVYSYKWAEGQWLLVDSTDLAKALEGQSGSSRYAPDSHYNGQFFINWTILGNVKLTANDTLGFASSYRSCNFSNDGLQASVESYTRFEDSLVGFSMDGEMELNYEHKITNIPKVNHKNGAVTNVPTNGLPSIKRERLLVSNGHYHKRKYLDQYWVDGTMYSDPHWDRCVSQISYNFKEYSIETTRLNKQIRLEVMHIAETDTFDIDFRADHAFLFNVDESPSECPKPADVFVRKDGSVVFDDETGIYISKSLGLPYMGW